MPDAFLAGLAANLEKHTTVLFRDGFGGAKAIQLDELEGMYGSLEQDGIVPWSIAGETRETPVFVVKDAEADKKAQAERSSKIGISVKDTGSATIPKKWREKDATDEDFADPVNYSYYIGDEEHARNALSRWAGNKSVYSSEEQAVIEKRLLAAAKKFNIDAESIDPKGEKAAGDKPMMRDCPNGDCNGKVPEGSDTCPTCKKGLKWDGSKPSLANPMSAEKQITLKSGSVILVIQEKDADVYLLPGDGSTRDFQTKLDDEHTVNLRVPANCEFSVLQEVTKELSEILTKDWDDDATEAYAPLIDDDDKIWQTFDSLWDGTLDAIDAIDDVAKAQQPDGEGGIDRDDLLKLLNQFVSACMARFDAMDSDSPMGQKEIREFIAVMKDVAPAIHTIIVEKAGARHSSTDYAAIKQIHEASIKLGYGDCMPKNLSLGDSSGTKDAKISNPGSDAIKSELVRVNEKMALVESDLKAEKDARLKVEADFERAQAALEQKDAELRARVDGRKPLPSKTANSNGKAAKVADSNALGYADTNAFIRSITGKKD